MTIRRLQSSDAAAYQQIRRHALNEGPQFVGPMAEQEALCGLPELQSRLENYEAEGVFPFGCFLGDECAGVASLTRKLNPRYSHKVFFWGLYVMPPYRGRSVARQLTETRIAFARSLPGVRFVTLQVTTTNKASHTLHSSFNFVSCGIEPQALNINGIFYDFETMQLDLMNTAAGNV